MTFDIGGAGFVFRSVPNAWKPSSRSYLNPSSQVPKNHFVSFMEREIHVCATEIPQSRKMGGQTRQEIRDAVTRLAQLLDEGAATPKAGTQACRTSEGDGCRQARIDGSTVHHPAEWSKEHPDRVSGGHVLMETGGWADNNLQEPATGKGGSNFVQGEALLLP